MGALARGARRSRKRFGAALAPFVLADADLRERRGELFGLERFEPIADYTSLAGDVAKMAHGAYLTELVRELSPERAAEPAVFDLYAEALSLLARRPARAELLRAFEIKLLSALGLLPSLDRCVGCGAGELGDAFDPGRGGMLCRACGPGALLLAGPAREALLALLPVELARAFEHTLPPQANAQARAVAIACVQHHLGKALRTPAFIADLRADPRAKPGADPAADRERRKPANPDGNPDGDS